MTVPEDDVPAHVRHFVDEYLDTVPQLETLLMMRDAGERAWLISEVAARNYITDQRAAETLQALCRRGLVVAEASPLCYRFNPQTDDLRTLIAELARCYQTSLFRITTLIHSKPSASVKEFARAFNLKKDR